MMEIKRITKEDEADIRIPNEPFPLFGRMSPSFSDGHWRYTIETLPENEVGEMRFPDENYDFDQMSDCVFFGAYDGEKCIGLAIFQREWHKYLYLYDLKVNADYRGQGVAKRLLEKGKALAATEGYRGLYTIGQDNNLAACKFYIKTGFSIGGFNNHVYNGTSQEGKADIYFYLDF